MRRSWLRRIRFGVVAACLLSAGAAAAPSASWALNSNGPLSFTATAPAARITIQTTPQSALTCATPSLTGRIGGPVISTGWINNPTPSEDGGPFRFWFSGCSVNGLSAIVTCPATVNFYANTFNGTVLAGELRAVSCSITVPALPMCAIWLTSAGPLSRGLFTAYTNPPTRQFAMQAASQTLKATWSSCPLLPPPTGTAAATLTNTGGGNLIYTVAPTAPLFW